MTKIGRSNVIAISVVIGVWVGVWVSGIAIGLYIFSLMLTVSEK